MDDAESLENPAPVAPRRVSAYLAVSIVLACALLGYAISLMVPLRPAPASPDRARPAPVAKTGTFEILPANPIESPRIAVHRAAVTDLPRIPARQSRSRLKARSLHPPPQSRRVLSLRCRASPGGGGRAKGRAQRGQDARGRSRRDPNPPDAPRRPRRVYLASQTKAAGRTGRGVFLGAHEIAAPEAYPRTAGFQPAPTASCSEQNQRSPRAFWMRPRS